MFRSSLRHATAAAVSSFPCFFDNRVAPRACASVLTLAMSASVALAQQTLPPEPTMFDSIAVTAARSSQPIADVLADITVIGAAEIARAGAQSVTELLQRQPGVEIVQNGGPGAVSGVFLRGANRGQTLVLIDGVRIASSSAGSTSLEAIPLDQIDRIEILRGPASSLYGADAIGGVVQVFTRRGTSVLSGNASAGYGTYGTWDVKGGVSATAGPVQFAVQAAAKGSNGFNTITNPANFLYNPDPDGYSNRSVSANIGFTAAPGQELSAQYFRSRLDNQFDGGPDFDDRTITVAETWQVASRNRLSAFWVSRLSAGAGIDDSQTQTAYGTFPFKTTQRQYAWQNEFTLPVGALTAGFERREEQVATDAGFATTERNTNSLFGIYQLRVDEHALQANLRRDDSTQYGGKTTGAFTYGYRFAPSLRATAGYATGFKAPSFNDLYYPGFANPDLVPETSKNFEAGVYWNGNVAGVGIEARAIGYRNRISQLIVFQCDANFSCAPYNVDRATLEGVTFGLEARAENGAMVTASLDLQSPEDDVTGKLLPRRARQHGALTAGYPLGPARVGVELIASSLRYDDPANLLKMGGYAIVNVTAEWVLPHGITLFARVGNVFDKNYDLAAGYATGGATVFAGVRAQLR
jgi:vitamin B12 transporter